MSPVQLNQEPPACLETKASLRTDDLARQVKDLAAKSDDAGRQELVVMLRDLVGSIERPNETLQRIGYLHLQTAAVRIGFDLRLFETMTKDEDPVSVEQIVKTVGADPHFIGRLMTYLSSIGVVKEAGVDLYAANNVTRNLALEMTEAGICHCFETIGPQYQDLPRFMRETSYQNPTDHMHTVFQTSWRSNLHQFAWFKDHPDNLKYFNNYMALRRTADVSWLSVYPVEEETKDWDPEKPVYVNMGGGIGHQCRQFKERYPNVPGKVILQDLEHSIGSALETEGVENMIHNFFDPQPVKGAKFYFTRGVLHNHPDARARTILSHIKAAMSPESIILLDEWVLPLQGVSSYAAGMDLTLMAAMAGVERNERQWRELLDSVGLRLERVMVYNAVSYESVMDVRVK